MPSNDDSSLWNVLLVAVISLVEGIIAADVAALPLAAVDLVASLNVAAVFFFVFLASGRDSAPMVDDDLLKSARLVEFMTMVM